MGTHNALWRLDCCYLEVVAIDPAVPSPARPRWFGLDNPLTQARLRTRPRVLTWVIATNAIILDHASAPLGPGQILDIERDHLRWKITVPKDGSLPEGGAFPTLIEWGKSTTSPARSLPDQGLVLQELTVGLADDRARWLTQRGIRAPVAFAAKQGLHATVVIAHTGASVLLD